MRRKKKKIYKHDDDDFKDDNADKEIVVKEKNIRYQHLTLPFFKHFFLNHLLQGLLLAESRNNLGKRSTISFLPDKTVSDIDLDLSYSERIDNLECQNIHIYTYFFPLSALICTWKHIEAFTYRSIIVV